MDGIIIVFILLLFGVIGFSAISSIKYEREEVRDEAAQPASKAKTLFMWGFSIGFILNFAMYHVNKSALERIGQRYPLNGFEVFFQSIGTGIGVWLLLLITKYMFIGVKMLMRRGL